MTEKEFLEKRLPFWLEGDDLRITVPNNTDRNDIHVFLSKKYNYGWMFAIRGYYWPESHIQLYVNDYETPNITVMVARYLLQFFDDAKYLGLGCNKGNVGEIWTPKLVIPRDFSMLKDDIRSI